MRQHKIAPLSFAIALCVTLLALTGASFAKATGTILRYDSDGNVVGRTQNTIEATPNAPVDAAAADGTGAGENGQAAATVGFEQDRVLAASADPSFLRSARSLGFTLIDRATLTSLDLDVVKLRTPAAADTEDALAMLRAAFPNVAADLNSDIAPSERSHGWDAAGSVGWPSARSACGRGITIGMIDTPVDTSHEAFEGRSIVHQSFLADDLIPAAPDHGTAVAALLVGNPESDGYGGLLPGATLVAGSIFERHATGRTVGNLFGLLKALDWMASQQVDVLNLSLETGENVILSKAVDQALRRGLVITAAAGNGGASASPAYPAALPNVIAVTALDPGLEPYTHANHGDYIDFAAPGVQLWTAVPGGGQVQSGTSFAVPFLTAATAMQLASGTSANSEALRTSLVQYVRDLGSPGKDEVFGWGMVQFSPTCG